MSINPYDAGLLLGAEVDVVLTNINSEPVCAHELLTEKDYNVERCVGEHESDINHNHFKPKRNMVRIYSANSHCRAWAIDNFWHTLKHLVVVLKKRAHVSFHSAYYDEEDKQHTAGGHIRLSQSDNGIYARKGEKIIASMLDREDETKDQKRLVRNLHLTIGLLGALLDRRPAAESRRKKFGAGTKKCIRKTPNYFTYQGISNFWIYHPSLVHLMFGAARMAVFLGLNDETYNLCKIKEYKLSTIQYAIQESDYETLEAIWNTIKGRFVTVGHPAHNNVFQMKLVKTIDFLIEYGIGVLGPGVYKNWRMTRRKANYQGHLSDLPGWEDSVKTRVFHKKHELHDEFVKSTS